MNLKQLSTRAFFSLYAFACGVICLYMVSLESWATAFTFGLAGAGFTLAALFEDRPGES